MAAVLPRKLASSLEHLVARVRTIRTLQALAWAGILIPTVPFACMVADAYWNLSSYVRVPLLLAWCVLVLWQVRRVWRVYVTPIGMEEVASVVELEYPRLAERLTTAVELAEHADESNGSPALIEEVINDADVRARKLDLDAAFPRSGAVGAFLFALILFAVVLTPMFMSPQAGQYLRRFFGAWYNPAPAVNYRVVITSGNEAVKRGDPITLTAYVEATKPEAELPKAATLVLTVHGKEERLAMTANEDNIWHLRRPAVESDFDYRVEAGLAASETKHVNVVDPVVLSSAKVQIKPPAYAMQGRELDPPIEGLGELTALEHSTITFNFRFQPKATTAVLQFTAEANPDKAKVDKNRYPLKIADDGSATLTVPAKVSGTFLLTAEGEHAVRTEFPPQPLHVHQDEAPKFPRALGLTDKPRDVRPTEKIQIECTAHDDVRIDQLVLEMRINDGPVERLPLEAPHLKTALVDGRISFVIKDKLKATNMATGDVLACRLAATDNRHVPEVGLLPRTSYFPEKDVWAEFRINPNADPLAEQDILAKKREIANKLKDIRTDLLAEARAANRLKVDTANRRSLTPDEQDGLKKLRQDVDETGNKIEDLARDTGNTPELKRLAESIRQLADREVRDAENALAKAREETKPTDRTDEFKKANEALDQAIRKTDELLQDNEKAAKERLDQLKLQDIAQQQQDLADAAKKPDANPEELAKKQRELEQRLKELEEQSDAIRKATEAIKATEAKKLADEADRIASEMRDLNKAMQKSDQNGLQERLTELKKKQDELAKKARELAQKSDSATRVSQTPPLQPDDTEAARNALDKGNLDIAAKEQEKARQELERLARDLEKAVADRRDPRSAATQLARLQEDLRQRVTQETQKTPLDQLPAEKRQTFEKQQEAIERAIKQLKTPEGDQGASVSKDIATADAAKAREMLKQGAQAGADTKMKETKEALEQLASKLPTMEQRTAKAKDELAKLKQQQEELRQQADQAVKNADKQAPDSDASRRELAKKLADASKQQAVLADKINKLDTPEQEKRRDKVAEAMQQAATDMTAGRSQDVAASQQAVKRELERLEQALNGQTPADDKVAELTKKQQTLAAEAARNAEKPDRGAHADIAKRQGDIARELEKLQTPEAAAAQAEATDAAKKAEAAGRDATKPAELAKRTQEAAAKLEQLNERVNGQEKAAETADRLAKKQKENAADQEKRKDNASTGEARKKAAQEAEELKNLRAGPNAQQAKQQAQEALQRAQNTLDPTANAQAQRDAAQALEKLAEQLSRDQKAQAVPEGPPQNPADESERLSKKQREAAEALQQANEQAKQQGGEAGKQAMKEAMQKAAEQQRDLAKQAEQLPGHDAPKERQQAQEAMRKAQEELDRENFEGAMKQQREAADALDRLSRESKEKQQQRANDNNPHMPNQQLADEAKQLAEEQRKLRDEAMKAADELAKENLPAKDNPVDELAKQQQQIAQQTADLAKTISDRQGTQAEQTRQARQAADAAKQTSNQVRNGELEQAKQSGEQAAQALEQMAKNNMGTESGRKADDLARQQGDINKKLEELAGNRNAARAQQQARQEQLEQQARETGKRLEELAQQAGMANGKDSAASDKAKEAGQSAQQAGQKMQDARQAGQKGQRDLAGQSREQAADAMKRASQQASEAAKQLGGEQPGNPQAGQALQQAQDNMQRAKQQLGQKQAGEASGAMEKAAQQLQQASNELQQGQQGQGQNGQPSPGQPGNPTNPGGNVGGPGGKLDLRQFSEDVAKYSGKAWGELPGNIRTKLIQEMKARYGEDYARNIKLYFEQLAERK